MTTQRKKALEKNFQKIFWIRAFLNLKFINAVLSLFYLHRGLSLSEIFLVSMVWAVATLLFEIPSSYLADRWGRKKTIMLGTVCMVLSWAVTIFAHSFFFFAIAIAFYGLSYAAISGTDKALVYDTERELGREKKTANTLARYHSAVSIFKIVTPIIGAFIAMDLTEGQFVSLLAIDVVACIIATFIATRLTEPDHKMDVHKMEAGIIKDGWRLLRTHEGLFRAILNSEMIFFGTLICFTFYQKYFFDVGVPILILGIGWGFSHAVRFVYWWTVDHANAKRSIQHQIRRLNVWYAVAMFVFLVSVLLHAGPFVQYSLFIIFMILGSLQRPLFSEFFNKRFTSFNRASSISLANLVHNVVEFPIFILTAFLISVDITYPFYLAFALALFAIFFLPIGKKLRVQRT